MLYIEIERVRSWKSKKIERKRINIPFDVIISYGLMDLWLSSPLHPLFME